MKTAWALLFLISDVAVGTALVALLCCREPVLPKRIEQFFPLRGRWLWCFLVALVVIAYLALAPSFLVALIHLIRRR